MESLKTKVRFSCKTVGVSRSLDGERNPQARPGEDALESLWDSLAVGFFSVKECGIALATLDREKNESRIPTPSDLRAGSPDVEWCRSTDRQRHKKQSKCGSLSDSLSNRQKQLRRHVASVHLCVIHIITAQPPPAYRRV